MSITKKVEIDFQRNFLALLTPFSKYLSDLQINLDQVKKGLKIDLGMPQLRRLCLNLSNFYGPLNKSFPTISGLPQDLIVTFYDNEIKITGFLAEGVTTLDKSLFKWKEFGFSVSPKVF